MPRALPALVLALALPLCARAEFVAQESDFRCLLV